MASEKIVDLAAKIGALCERISITTDKFVRLIGKEPYNITDKSSNKWVDGVNRRINDAYREKFIQFWIFYDHPIDHRFWSISLEEFPKYLEDMKVKHQDGVSFVAKKVMPFVGAYQIIRPYTTSANVYTLECMEISVGPTGANILMYSHNNRSSDYLYDGPIMVADRYLFSLLSRKHETDGAKNAFRSVSFYVGPGADPGYLSGLMLRGVTGGGSNQAVCVPFVAIKSSENVSLKHCEIVEYRAKHLSIIKDKHMLLGEAGNNQAPTIYGYCKTIFDGLNLYGVFDSDTITMRTIAPSNLKFISGVDFLSWKGMVDDFKPA